VTLSGTSGLFGFSCYSHSVARRRGHPKKVEAGEIARLRCEALTLRTKSWSYREIAERMGIHEHTAFDYVKAELARLTDYREKLGKTLIQHELQITEKTLRRMTEILEGHDIDPDTHANAARTINQILARRSALLGLDAPTKTEVSGKMTLEDLVTGSYSVCSDPERKPK